MEGYVANLVVYDLKIECFFRTGGSSFCKVSFDSDRESAETELCVSPRAYWRYEIVAIVATAGMRMSRPICDFVIFSISPLERKFSQLKSPTSPFLAV